MKTQDAVTQMAKDGIKHDAHHATIKAAFKTLTGQALSKDDLVSVRSLLEDAKPVKAKKAPVEVVEMTEAERMKRAKEVVAERAEDADMPGWANVRKVVEAGKDGLPNRVIIECQDPQEKGGKSTCVKTREIAAQDVFQVHRCEPCQKRANVIKRNLAAKERRAEANKATKKATKSSK